MTTLYIFVEDPIIDAYPSIGLNADGSEQFPLSLRTINELQKCAVNACITLVLPATRATITTASLPIKNTNKIRLALPNLLEEEIAQELDDVHISFDSHFMRDEAYLVTIIDREYFHSLLDFFRQNQLPIDAVTLDYFAVAKDQAWQLEERIIINSEHYHGSLSNTLFEQLKPSFDQQTLSFKPFSNEQYHQTASEQLNQRGFINLCQGEFLVKKANAARVWQITAAIALVWGVVFMGGLVTKYFWLNHVNKRLSGEVATLYQSFFPGASQVVSPKFRITNKLKEQQAGSQDAELFVILRTAGPIIRAVSSIQVVKLEYAKKKVLLDLHSDDFEELASLQKKLKSKGLKIKQQSASSDEGMVKARWELST